MEEVKNLKLYINMENKYYIIGAIVLLIFMVVGLYNRLVIRRNEVNNAFGSIDAMLKKRFDLLPNLVETTRQYMNYEKSLLTEITALRSQINSNLPTNEKIEKYNTIQKQVDGLMLTVENYPELMANKSFIDLQKSWNTAEEQISASRRYFNAAVTDYNIAIQAFPSNIIAKIFKFNTLQVFEISEAERLNINAKDLFA